jgi:hypothetical protein
MGIGDMPSRNDPIVSMKDLKNSIIPVIKDLAPTVVSEINPIDGWTIETTQFTALPTKVVIACIYGIIPTKKLPIVDVRNVTVIINKKISGTTNTITEIQ